MGYRSMMKAYHTDFNICFRKYNQARSSYLVILKRRLIDHLIHFGIMFNLIEINIKPGKLGEKFYL